MKTYLNVLLLVLAIGLQACLVETEPKPVPELKGRINDYADFLSPEAEEALEARLKAFEDSTTNQVVFIGVESIAPEEPEEYALRVGRVWGIGQADENNGILFLLAREGSRVRIEVGYGLEGALTDAEASRLVAQIPEDLESGQFDEVVESTLDGIITAVEGEYTAEDDESEGLSGFWIMVIIIIALLVLFILVASSGSGSGGGYYRSSGSSGGWSGGSSGGGSFGGGFSGGGGGFGGGGAGR